MLFPTSTQLHTESSDGIEPQLSFSSASDNNFDGIFNNTTMCAQTKAMPSNDHINTDVFRHERHPQVTATTSNESINWQTSSDIPDRLRLLANVRTIVVQKLLQSPNAINMVAKLPTMSRKMEEILYRAAHSKEEYLDLSTLEPRLAMIARALEASGAPGVVPASARHQQHAPGVVFASARHQQQHQKSGPRLDFPKPVAAASAAAVATNHGDASSPTLTVPWQSPADQQDRLSMMTYIRQIVKKQIVEKNEYPEQILKKLPQVSKMMEIALYKSAPTKSDYLDLSTLNSRLQAITDELLSGRQPSQKVAAV